MLKHETQLQKMITHLRTRLLVMCATTTIAVDEACLALRQGSMGRAQAIIEGDEAIDALETEIDELALSLLVRTQPVAYDLRFIIGTVRMVIDLERIGDEAASIAERILMLEGDTKAVLQIVEPLANESRRLLTQSIAAFKENDLEQARQVCSENDEIAQAEITAIQRIMDSLSAPSRHSVTYAGINAILMSRAFNRIGRRAMNIAEHLYFIENGVNVKHTLPS